MKPLTLVLSFLLASAANAATLRVTRLADDTNPGSIRHAVATAKPGDAIRFAITGTVNLKSRLDIKGLEHVTITGHARGTALVGAMVCVGPLAKDVTLENLRIRFAQKMTGEAIDEESLRLFDFGSIALLIFNSTAVTVRHCSIQNSTDDNLCVIDSQSVVVEDCIISGGFGRERKGILAYTSPAAGFQNPTIAVTPAQSLTLRRCLITRLDYRMPKGRDIYLHLNANVIVGYSTGAEYQWTRGDIVGNWFWPGPGCATKAVLSAPSRLIEGGLYVSDNWLSGRQCVDDWKELIGQAQLTTFVHERRFSRIDPWERPDHPDDPPYESVLRDAGPAARDTTDLLAIAYTRFVCEGAWR